MKKLSILAIALASVQFSQAAVTLSFSNSTNWLSNFQNGAGSSADNPATAAVTENRLVWGILVDAAGDGFDGATNTNPYDSGFSLAANNTGLQLNLHTGTATDDVLYISSALMANSSTPPAGEGTNAVSVNRILSFTGLNFNAPLGVGAGDKYAIIWFDATTLGGNTSDGLKYGILELPAAINLLPPDGTNASTYPAQFAGADESKPMGFALGTPVPETSTSLLGALGALALLRRRRN
jgi:hypothetical protein